MAAPDNKDVWTYERLATLEHRQNYELFDGSLSEAVSLPSSEHTCSLLELAIQIKLFVEAHDEGQVFLAPIDVIFDARNVVRPDITFVSKKRYFIIEDEGIFGAPDLTVEIVSPPTHFRDNQQKVNLYRKFGVKECWLVDPFSRLLEIMVLDKDSNYTLFSAAHPDSALQHKARSKILAGLEVAQEFIFRES